MPADADFIVLDARIDLKQWDKAIAEMEADARLLQSKPLEITVKINDKGLRAIQQQVAGLDTDVTADVKFTTSGDDIAHLREEWDDPLQAKVKFTQVGDDIVGLRDKLDDTIQTDVKFTQTGDDIAGALDDLNDVVVEVKLEEDSSVDSTISVIEGKLDDLKTLAKIQLVLDAASFVKDIGEIPLVGALLEIEDLSHRVTGQTGRDLENVGRTINNVWTGNWGESKEEIADVVTTVAQMRDTSGDFLVQAGDIENVTVGAFQAAAVGGAETLEVLRAATQMVKNGFVPGFQDAFDIIASGYSRGFDQSGDFLDTLIEYSSTYSQLGISANGFFNILRGGTESGVFNTDKMADSFKEMLNLTKEEVAAYKELGDETDRTRALNEAGLMDEATAYTAGEITGDEFSQAVIDTLVAQFDDPATQQRLAKAIFSPTMVEDAGLPALLQTDFQQSNIWAGQAKLLSDEIFSGPGSAFTTMQRTLETHFLNALMNSVEAQEFMDKITIAAQRFGTELASGASIGEALEVSLEMPGLADKITQLESVLGNFIIDFIDALANVGEALGADVSGMREAVSRYGAGQLSFDLQIAQTEEEITSAIQRAIDRGVSGADTTQAISTAVTEMLDEGNITRAQELVANLSQIPEIDLGEKASTVLEAAGGNLDTALFALEEARKNFENSPSIAGQAQLADIDQAIGEIKAKMSEVDTETLQAQVNEYVAALSQELQSAVSSGDFDLAKTIGDQLGVQNIDQLISEQQAQSTLDALFPKPTQAELDQYLQDSFLGLQEGLLAGDFAGAASFAEKLLDTENPTVQAAVDDFATTLMVQFNNALNAGDTETAEDILSIMGLSPENNQIAIDSMTQRLTQFSEDGVYQVDQVTESFSDMGGQVTESTEQGVGGVSKLYGSIMSETGVLGQERLRSLAKRFDAVALAIKSALEQINEAEDKVGSGAIKGAAVGGIRGEGVTMVGEAGRELIFSDERFAVLNNQSTERLYTALSNMAGAGNTTSNNRTVNYNPTIIVQNEAQASMFGNHALNQLRGEAF